MERAQEETWLEEDDYRYQLASEGPGQTSQEERSKKG